LLINIHEAVGASENPAVMWTSTDLAASLGSAFGQAALLMGGLILATGARNALVLRQGLLRSPVTPVVVCCAVSDWVRTAAGAFGRQLALAGTTLRAAGHRCIHRGGDAGHRPGAAARSSSGVTLHPLTPVLT
jgi:hypothetical protein